MASSAEREEESASSHDQPVAAIEDEERRLQREILAARLREARRNIGSPTRTLLLTQQEQSNSRDPTPSEIANRSPRARTPRQRFESPLEHDALRRVDDDDESTSQRITIRLNAGLGVGVRGPLAVRHEARAEDGAQQERSAKQGPSHRKVRRWNNDRLVDLDLTSAKVKNIYAKARSEVHLHRAIYNPNEDCQRSETVSRFMQDDTLKGKRDTFFEGSGPTPSSSNMKNAAAPKPKHSLSRIEPRLRRLVIRACQNSCAATKVLQQLEAYLFHRYFSQGEKKEMPIEWWSDLLVEEPTTDRSEKLGSEETKLSVQFSFQQTQNSGFHRLLLHALCQFHGLTASAKNSSSNKDLRMSTITGTIAENIDTTTPLSLITCIEERERIVAA